MLLALIAASLAASTAAPGSPLGEARHAIEAGRIDQARAMVADAIAEGASGDVVDELLADIAFEGANNSEALARYEALAISQPGRGKLAERAGIAALRVGNIAKGKMHLVRAVNLPPVSWRAWNARGVAADLEADWETAEHAYAAAAELKPDSSEIANNRGWSLLLQGRWDEAVKPLERAAKRDPESKRIANNLELARVAIADNLPRRRRGESTEAWAARLNDAGVVANAQGDRKRAIAAFTQAIEARNDWFERAANNMANVGERE